ncbi:GNAT family N-acetyltransferase [Laceyella sacchari]|jgi:[ribosomal protein S18]-alanine N-acetyltransferase|uniref:GNAT family N-acetyltransferase n=1 Tax=Laceyella sacchari TaxID=37482 RepID=A0ABY5U2X0_LACSH|nr:GNAT family N-acetyltransferase [Laceyella sacchari]TCW36172.1 putative N-acetyltransferase YhbS [Laceyella sacchari]UWE03986.1 GNAT family N-acetyltransferase [Laceyella sacchari]
MRLRSFQLADAHDVSQIWQMTASHEQEKDTLQVLTEQLGYDRDLVIVAEAPNGRVVGAIVGTIDGHTGFFYCLAVHPDYQKRKVGTMLVRELEQRFLQKGVKRIWITVDEGTEKLFPFYQHLGYTNGCSTRLEKELYAFSSCSHGQTG